MTATLTSDNLDKDRCPRCGVVLSSSPKPLNAQIAEALGWNVWEDPRPGKQGTWFQENKTHVMPVLDYLSVCRNYQSARIAELMRNG